ncbi:hypothetical protein [Streptomyces sp. NPDC048650]|uniref:hypothetical protein n=1 Tax=unclassified Streptomyces TaxID=2593676 RepID=UPI00371DFC28
MTTPREGNRLRALPTEYVDRVRCTHCDLRTMKLPGTAGGLCIPCYALERQAAPRRTGQGTQMANFVSDPCMGCGSHAVDANGWAFWCDACGMQVAVAYPQP